MLILLVEAPLGASCMGPTPWSTIPPTPITSSRTQAAHTYHWQPTSTTLEEHAEDFKAQLLTIIDSNRGQSLHIRIVVRGFVAEHLYDHVLLPALFDGESSWLPSSYLDLHLYGVSSNGSFRWTHPALGTDIVLRHTDGTVRRYPSVAAATRSPPFVTCVRFDAVPPNVSGHASPLVFGSLESVLRANKPGAPNSSSAATATVTTPVPIQLPPISPFVPDILTMIASAPTRISFIDGPTGCGKSTVVPCALLDSNPKHVVWCMQPRRVASVALATRINTMRVAEGGSNRDAAFTIGGQSTEDPAYTRLLFMTPGVLLQRLASGFREGTYLQNERLTHILLDEIHERSVEGDVLCALVRTLVRYNPAVRIIIMSATMSTWELQQYMMRGSLGMGGLVSMWPRTPSSPDTNSREWATTPNIVERAIPAFHVETAVASLPTNDPSSPPNRHGRSIHYLDEMHSCITQGVDPSGTRRADPLHDLVSLEDILTNPAQRGAHPRVALTQIRLSRGRLQLLIQFIAWLHTAAPIHESVLVFLSGIGAIEAVMEQMDTTTTVGGVPLRDQLNLVVLHSAIDMDLETKRLYNPAPSGCRTVILSTNVAESSLTIPGVDHVVDTCLAKDQSYLVEDKMVALVEQYCSKDSCTQRAGRTGRIQRGYVWRLVTQAEYNMLPANRTPALLQQPLTNSLLTVVDSAVGDLSQFLAALPQPPNQLHVTQALFDLEHHYRCIKAVSGGGTLSAKVTPKGSLFLALGLDVPQAQLVAYGLAFGVLEPCVQAAAILSARTPLLRDADASTLCMYDRGTNTDVVAQVEVFREWLRAEASIVPPPPPYVDVSRRAATEILDKYRDVLQRLGRLGLSCGVMVPQSTTALCTWDLGESQDGGYNDALQRAKAFEVWGRSGMDSLTSEELVLLVAVLSMTFVQTTLRCTDTPDQKQLKQRYLSKKDAHRKRKMGAHSAISENVEFLPSFKFEVRHNTSPSSRDIEMLAEEVLPCTLADISRDDTTTTFKLMPPQVTASFTNRAPITDPVYVVRNVLAEGFRLCKLGRTRNCELNIRHVTCSDDEHFLSSWFSKLSAPCFLRHNSMAYPLPFDPRLLGSPTLVGVSMQRVSNKVHVASAVFLPGTLSYLPHTLAIVAHGIPHTADNSTTPPTSTTAAFAAQLKAASRGEAPPPLSESDGDGAHVATPDPSDEEDMVDGEGNPTSPSVPTNGWLARYGTNPTAEPLMPSLPLCRPSVSRMERMGVNLKLVEILNNGLKGMFGDVITHEDLYKITANIDNGTRSSSSSSTPADRYRSVAEAARVAISMGSRVEVLAKFQRLCLLQLMLPFLGSLPDYYAPRDIFNVVRDVRAAVFTPRPRKRPIPTTRYLSFRANVYKRHQALLRYRYPHEDPLLLIASAAQSTGRVLPPAAPEKLPTIDVAPNPEEPVHPCFPPTAQELLGNQEGRALVTVSRAAEGCRVWYEGLSTETQTGRSLLSMKNSPSGSIYGVPLLTDSKADCPSACLIQRHGQCCDVVGVAVTDIVLSCAARQCVDVLLVDLSVAVNMGIVSYNVVTRVGLMYQTIPALSTSRPLLGGVDGVTLGGSSSFSETVVSNIQLGLEGVYGGGGARQLSTLIPRRIHRTTLDTSHGPAVLPNIVSAALSEYHSRHLTLTNSPHQPWVVVCEQLVDVPPMPLAKQEVIFQRLWRGDVLASHTTLVGLRQDLSPSGWAILEMLSALAGRQGWTLVVVLPSSSQHLRVSADDPLASWAEGSMRGLLWSSEEVQQVPIQRGDSWMWRVASITPLY